jgi:tyrosyl-tRNA synthetase
LAYEVTKILHGQQEAEAALQASRALFAGEAGEAGAVPTTRLTPAEAAAGFTVITLLEKTRLIPSRSEGRRLIEQGGVRLNGEPAQAFDQPVPAEALAGGLLIQKGKKIFHRVEVGEYSEF